MRREFAYFLFKDEKEIENWLKEADEIGEFAIDTETTSLDAHQTDLVGISLCYKPGYSGYIPLAHKSGKNLNTTKVLSILKPYLEDKSIKKIGQNIKFDYIVFSQRGIKISSIEDTMLMSYVLDAGRNRHNLDTLAELHFKHKNISFKDIVGTGKKQLNFSEVEIPTAKDYAAEDTDITLRLYEILSERVSEQKLEKIYEIFEKPMIKILSKLETSGIKVDDAYLKKLSKEINKINDNKKK